MQIFQHSSGDRVHVLLRHQDALRGVEWLPGEVRETHVRFGRARYVVRLDDGRRLLASNYELRRRPPIAWTHDAMAETLDLAS